MRTRIRVRIIYVKLTSSPLVIPLRSRRLSAGTEGALLEEQRPLLDDFPPDFPARPFEERFPRNYCDSTSKTKKEFIMGGGPPSRKTEVLRRSRDHAPS